MRSAAEVIAGTLKDQGTGYLFGVPGGGSLDLLEAARKRGIPFVMTHTETAAAIMAAVHGELTGTPGVAITTLGPGVASAINGVAYAFLDRAPMLLISDRYPDHLLPLFEHQQLDHSRLLAPVVKWSAVLTASSAQQTLLTALRIASSEPWGPVHLDLPGDVSRASTESQEGVKALLDHGRSVHPSPEAIEHAARLLASARSPLILVGLGLRQEGEARTLKALAEHLHAPVLTTYKGKGSIPEDHPLSAGIYTGALLDDEWMKRADLIVAVGFDPVELIPRPQRFDGRVLVISNGPPLPGPFQADLALLGAIGASLKALIENSPPASRDVRWVAELKASLRARLLIPSSGLTPHRVVETAREIAPPETIATVDAGAHMFPATLFWKASRPGTFLISNGLSTMGFALPAALSAKLLHPRCPVLAFTGDGGFLLAAQELETAARLGLPIVVLIFNDHSLSLIKVKQLQRGFPPSGVDFNPIDFVSLAGGFGVSGVKVGSEEDLKAALISAFQTGGPFVIQAEIDASGYRSLFEAIRGSV